MDTKQLQDLLARSRIRARHRPSTTTPLSRERIESLIARKDTRARPRAKPFGPTAVQTFAKGAKREVAARRRGADAGAK